MRPRTANARCADTEAQGEGEEAWGGWGNRAAYERSKFIIERRSFFLARAGGFFADLADYLPPVPTEADIDAVDLLNGIPLTGSRGQIGGALVMMGGFTAVAGGAFGGLALTAPEVTMAAVGVDWVRTRSEIFMDLWGKGVEGARATLSSVESGTFKLVPDLTLGQLNWYAMRAQNMINVGGGDSYGGYMVQSLRLQIIMKISPMFK